MLPDVKYWKQIKTEDFLQSLGKNQTKSNRPHNFSGKLKSYPKPYCVRCGLILLNNKATDVAVRQGC